tara:strand:+ start:29231 stop:29332 length:102 start_codon:yes stop_codon:yes gene_type:complete
LLFIASNVPEKFDANKRILKNQLKELKEKVKFL